MRKKINWAKYCWLLRLRNRHDYRTVRSCAEFQKDNTIHCGQQHCIPVSESCASCAGIPVFAVPAEDGFRLVTLSDTIILKNKVMANLLQFSPETISRCRIHRKGIFLSMRPHTHGTKSRSPSLNAPHPSAIV